MSTQGDLVLVTGATGFLGYIVLVEAIKAGYRVRIALRSEGKLQNVLNASTLKSLNVKSDQLSWVIVPDMAAPGAYDEAVKGVKYIIHVASPIPSFGGPNPPAQEEYESYFVKPALAGEIGMLQSAAKEPSVKRVVITSSVVAIVPFEYNLGKGDFNRVFSAADRVPFAEPPYSAEFEAYSAGKVAALNAAEKFVREQKPGFDLISVIPGWIFGRDELVTRAESMRAESTNSVLLSFLTGLKNDAAYNGNMVLGQDVAKVHVLALNPKVPGNQAFIASSDVKWQDALKVVKERYPSAVAEGKLSLDGKQDTISLKIPGTETEKTLGIQFQPMEKMVTEVVDQYLELNA